MPGSSSRSVARIVPGARTFEGEGFLVQAFEDYRAGRLGSIVSR